MVLAFALALLGASITGAFLTWNQFRGGQMAPLWLDQLHLLNRIRFNRRDNEEMFWVMSIGNWAFCVLALIAGIVLLPIGLSVL